MFEFVARTGAHGSDFFIPIIKLDFEDLTGAAVQTAMFFAQGAFVRIKADIVLSRSILVTMVGYHLYTRFLLPGTVREQETIRKVPFPKQRE
ncbi:Hypothetical protein DEACI_1770 [Acididesulfobacillus acetoxydans]|uniref:Uncharacterized protein n=1 Tax=Acididesulfobacillus acetoxydans TaxID=1561005 RepID=A0A8S0XWL9_9FIRM|nr:Hypothetical protein DEACI_1770 [Acididesulfobacillus acetoxydans]CEJ08604.1 Hypothetical protein DEACI_3083 [Acididesulfobacillus acetoxydans]